MWHLESRLPLQQEPVPPSLAARGELLLIADDSVGLRVRLVNATCRDLEITTWDGIPLVLQEALDEQGTWRRIQWISAKCGNSLGWARLAAGYECSFAGKRHEGPIRTRLRFRLDVGADRMITSNEYEGSIPRWPAHPVSYWIGLLEYNTERAQSGLLEIGEPAVPALLDVLRFGSLRSREAAETVLRAMEPAGPEELEEVLHRPLPMGGWFVDGPMYGTLRTHSAVRIEGEFDLRESRWNESERRIEALRGAVPPWPDLHLKEREEIRSELGVRAVLFTFSRDRRERNVRYVLLSASFALVCVTEP